MGCVKRVSKPLFRVMAVVQGLARGVFRGCWGLLGAGWGAGVGCTGTAYRARNPDQKIAKQTEHDISP